MKYGMSIGVPTLGSNGSKAAMSARSPPACNAYRFIGFTASYLAFE
jgi:hypothetical protein